MTLSTLWLILLSTHVSALRSFSLDEALHIAAVQAPPLHAAQARIRAQNAKVGQAFAGFLPQLDVQGQYLRSTGNFMLSPAFADQRMQPRFRDGPTAQTMRWETMDDLRYGITAQITLWDFGRTAGAYDAAQADRDGAAAQLQYAAMDVAMQVRVRYYHALAQKELTGVGRDTANNQQKHVDDIARMVTAGSRPQIELSSAEVKRDGAQIMLLRYETGYAAAKVALSQAMGWVGDMDFDLTVPNEAPFAEENELPESVIERALDTRPEFNQLQATLERLEAQTWEARSGYFPTFAAVSHFSGAKVDNAAGGWNFYAGITANWNLFAGGHNYRQSEAIQATYDAILAQRDTMAQAVRAEVMQVRLALSEAKRRVDVLEHAAQSAQTQLALAEGRYRTLQGSILELHDGQFSWAQARADYIQAQCDLRTARARLLRALGRGAP